MKIKLIDFGLCDFTDSMPDYQCRNFVGSFEYAAPEVLLERPYDGQIADSWSCGVVLYTLLFGEFPFSLATQRDFIYNGTVPVIEWPDARMKDRFVSWTVKDMITKMLTVDPKIRFNMEMLSEHKWLSNSPCNSPTPSRVPPPLSSCVAVA